MIMSITIGSSDLQTSNFTTQDAGKTVGTAQGDMPQGSQVSINGSVDLSAIIVGPAGAFDRISSGSNRLVKTINYEHLDGIARNSVVNVYGQGPEGMGSGSMKLTFVTANGTHDLSLTSSSPGWHSDKFSDGSPITSITWFPD